MKYFLSLLLCFCMATAFSQSANDRIGKLINTQSYFKLKRELEKADSTQLHPILWHMAGAFVNTYFNRPEKAIRNIKTLLTDYQQEMGGNNIGMLYLMIENCANMREYGKAAELAAGIVAQAMSNEELLANFKLLQRTYDAMAKVSAQKLYLGKQHIKVKKDKVGLMRIPVKAASGNTQSLIFDTGFKYSAIRESLAESLNVRILVDSVEFSIMGRSHVCWAKLGIAEQLQVGDIRAENVIFYVIPDADLTLTHEGKQVYVIDGAIGWDFIRDMKTMQINTSGSIAIGGNRRPSIEGNLMVIGLSPYVEAVSGTDTLSFMLDTGASPNATWLSYRYYQNHSQKLSQAKEELVNSGTVGEVMTDKVAVLNNFPLTVGGNCVIPRVEVLTMPPKSVVPPYDGTLGMGIVNLYSSMYINLNTMSIELKK